MRAQRRGLGKPKEKRKTVWVVLCVCVWKTIRKLKSIENVNGAKPELIPSLFSSFGLTKVQCEKGKKNVYWFVT